MVMIISSDSSGTGTRVLLANSGDAYVRAGRLVAASNATAIVGLGSGHGVTVSGEVVGVGGITLGNDITDGFNRLTVGDTGMVFGSDRAVGIFGVNSGLTNYGVIEGIEVGVKIAGSNASIVNHGDISGKIAVSSFQGSNTANLSVLISNHGTLSGSITAIDGGAFNERVHNFDTIIGRILLLTGDDTVINRGLIRGDVNLGSGNDVIDNRKGVVIGSVFGESGSDVFRPGAESETIDGGLGIDTLDFRGTPAVQVSLDGSVDGTGHADDDSYTGIERVFGSSYGDILVGDAGLNTLNGFGGKDSLSGGAGGDVLIGGNGIDVLTSGAGSDQFVFNRASEAGDLITDFTGTGSSADFIFVDVSGFAGGLLKGALATSKLQIRADNLAQDSNDRFIFRTSDKSLWYDEDGSGAEASFLLADLQSNAVLTAANIVLI